MAAPATWSEWLAGLWNSLRGPPAPGSHEAHLEEKRLGALLAKEAAKPPGQRDEERFYQLAVEHSRIMLENVQVGWRRRQRWRRAWFSGPGLCAQLPQVASFMPDRLHTCTTASQAGVRRLAMEVSMPEGPATGRNCCAASDWVRQRTAASRQAVLYYQQCVVQVGLWSDRAH